MKMPSEPRGVAMGKTVELCPGCGLPRGIGKGNKWHPNGVITASYPPYIRGTLYDVDEFNALFPAISKRIGFDITRLVVEGKRKDGKRYTDSLIGNLKAIGKDASPLDIYHMIARFAAYWGLGFSEVTEYREGERLVLQIRNAYSDPMCRGDWAGVFEASERKRGEAAWRDESKLDVMEIVAVEGEPELEERITQEVELGAPFTEDGDLQYRHCPDCGVPLEISHEFNWDAEASRITEVISGKRYILHNTNGIVAVMRVLHEELGNDIDGVITEITREYTRDHYTGLRDESSMDAELMKFPLRSWGRPARLHRVETGYRLRIVNPYCPPVVAGRLWGLLEAFEERAFAMSYIVEEEGSLDVTFTRA
jgi:hypothetical protein